LFCFVFGLIVWFIWFRYVLFDFMYLEFVLFVGS